MNKSQEPYIFALPKIMDPRGNLSFLQDNDQVPFSMERCYWLYDIPGNASRDGHAYHRSQEVIIALSGSFDVVLTDWKGHTERYHMNRSYNALFVPQLWWRELDNFSTNSVVMILSSTLYNPADYIRDFDTFRLEARNFYSKNASADE